jgi:hypothetical protein
VDQPGHSVERSKSVASCWRSISWDKPRRRHSLKTIVCWKPQMDISHFFRRSQNKLMNMILFWFVWTHGQPPFTNANNNNDTKPTNKSIKILLFWRVPQIILCFEQAEFFVQFQKHFITPFYCPTKVTVFHVDYIPEFQNRF